MRKIKCPYCGYEWNVDVEGTYKAGEAPLVKGGDKRARGSPEAKKHVDLICPNCKGEFQHPVKS